MIKPNWDIFKAKFNENPQDSFERFCYLLFCKEFNKPFGIFRYKNQVAIETEPIAIENQVIGWQAKFYGSTLSNHTNEIINSIIKAKQGHPEITDFLFYSNQEWAQNKGGMPKGLKEIEAKAEELAITLEWRTASYFESEFVSLDNVQIAKHFFSLDKSVSDDIQNQIQHTQNVLAQIQTSIQFNKQTIEIDRNDTIEKLLTNLQKAIIISGQGGVGKTVLIKNLHERLKKDTPFYVFKATEFELRNINDLFSGCTAIEFFEAHEFENKKTIVIDSAEKLIYLKNSDPFNEFLELLVKNKWQIIFTTRNNYLEDLNFLFLEVYKLAALYFAIDNLGKGELVSISSEYSFSLPKDEKLINLIRNPFYLNEYLKLYNPAEELRYEKFKNKLWKQIIKKSQPERENCFLSLALQRANEGQFFVAPECPSDILDAFFKDGILGHETAGYFITHDIYEEWALEKIIEREFIKKTTNHSFFESIGKALPVRRSFRKWLSEKLLLETDNINKFIEESLEDNQLESFWKDELLVSVLLSGYSKNFLETFKNRILADGQGLLKKLTFLLRLACKEVDENLSRLINDDKPDLFSIKYVYTKPKGQGWEEIINFIFENIEAIHLKNSKFILPVIHEWNNSNKRGETTKRASLIALKYYQWILDEKGYFSEDDSKKKIIQTILDGVFEIQDELREIFEDIIKNKWKFHRDPFYDLSKTILSELGGLSVSRILPKYVLKLAELFWILTPRPDDEFGRHHSRIEIEESFGLETWMQEYSPASAYRSPIYWLLKGSLKATIDFIIEITNMSVQAYVNSGFDPSVEKVKLFFDDREREQYISHCLWNMYRGASSPRSPDLLQSIHMALEKHLLEMGENSESPVLESWLLYLLKKSESASISAVVTSIVLAYPDKTFNVAKVLFKTKEFILFDTGRYAADLMSKTTNSFLTGLIPKQKVYEDERIKTSEDIHRKHALEHQFIEFQLIRKEGVTEEEANQRRDLLWEILDNYYQEIPAEDEQNEADKTWRLFLARMDRRNMSITTEEADEGVLIKFNPKLDSDLRDFSEKSLAEGSDLYKYTSLRIWASEKLGKDEKYKEYNQYESNPKLALDEAKEIKLKLTAIVSGQRGENADGRKMFFVRTNYSIPTYVCAVLFRENFDDLSEEDREYCKDVIIEAAYETLNPDYRYQISDGADAAISLLPSVLQKFPAEKNRLKTILLLTLFLEIPAGGIWSDESFKIYPINAIRGMWKDNFGDAKSLLFGYLLLAPLFEEYVKKLREGNYKKGNYSYGGHKPYPEFYDENKSLIEDVFDNQTTLDDIDQISKINLSILKTVFRLIPTKIDNEEIEEITKNIISVFAERLPVISRDNKIKYDIKHGFIEAYAYFILSLDPNDIQEFIKPFVEKFNTSEIYADLFQEFVVTEVKVGSYNSFWEVWNAFKDKVIVLCEKGDKKWHTDKIVKNYLLAHPFWKEDFKEWSALKDENKRFFSEISQKIGPSPAALFAISMLINGIGSHYLDDGIIWISNMLKNNKELFDIKLEKHTIYHIETIIRKYVYRNRDKVKITKNLKDSILVILNFLVNKGSVVGYMVRERII